MASMNSSLLALMCRVCRKAEGMICIRDHAVQKCLKLSLLTKPAATLLDKRVAVVKPLAIVCHTGEVGHLEAPFNRWGDLPIGLRVVQTVV